MKAKTDSNSSSINPTSRSRWRGTRIVSQHRTGTPGNNWVIYLIQHRELKSRWGPDRRRSGPHHPS
jgi:hypothetical protein